MATDHAKPTLWVLRHGERIDDVDPSWPSIADRPFDPPLTERGRQQALQTGRHFKEAGIAISHIFSSSFRRCLETAHEIVQVLGKNVRIEHGLCEFMNPRWFRTEPIFDDFHKLKMKGFPLVDTEHAQITPKPEYPETIEDMARQYRASAERLADIFLNEGTAPHILLVTHGYGVQWISESLCEGVAVTKADYCCLTQMVRNDSTVGWRCVQLASVHLQNK